jgi:hypothetical protein
MYCPVLRGQKHQKTIEEYSRRTIRFTYGYKVNWYTKKLIKFSARYIYW